VISWTERASADLVGIAEWITAQDPAASKRVVGAILAGVDRLAAYPLMGRNGRVPETREFVLPRLPYVVVYRPLADAVVILRVLHGAMRWPPPRT
jgi:toxin ParE1/3/4